MDSRPVPEEAVRGAERTLCDLEDVASGLDREEHQIQFRAAVVALRHYRECVHDES